MDFYHPLTSEHPINRVEIYQPQQGWTCEPAIRLYCTQRHAAWTLQVRGKRRNGKTYFIGNAGLYRDDLIALRDACNEALDK